jgi:putative flippase GtrA
MRAEFVSQVLRFGAVGVIGFIIDGGLLWLFISLGLNP